jgi:Tfp pilus assembly protein PilV
MISETALIVISVILTAIFAFIASTYWHNRNTKEKIAQTISNGM